MIRMAVKAIYDLQGRRRPRKQDKQLYIKYGYKIFIKLI